MKAALQLAIEQAFQQAEHAMQERRNTDAVGADRKLTQ